MQTKFIVSDESDLRAAITAIDPGGVDVGASS
jgi:hypothetical protein